MQSPAAANLLLQTDFTFALKRLDDKGLLDLLAHAASKECQDGPLLRKSDRILQDADVLNAPLAAIPAPSGAGQGNLFNKRKQLTAASVPQEEIVKADANVSKAEKQSGTTKDERNSGKGIVQAPPNETLQKFCIELLQSPRSDAIYEKSAQLLYRMVNEEMPKPFDLAKARSRFVPSAPAVVSAPATPVAETKKETVAAPAVRGISLRTHVVKEGDSLWKISRQYHVKLDDLRAINHLEKDRLKLGMVLKIPASPQGTGSKPPR